MMPASVRRPSMRSRRIFLVLGMHRSGTSMIARGIGALGADLGSNLKPAVAGDNDKGFWEDAELSAVNDAVLELAGCRWDSLDLARVWTLTTDSLEPLRRTATEILQRRFDKTSVFAFKDPRTSVTLRFWQPVFEKLDLVDRYVIAFRNPGSVARSLHRRDGFDPLKSGCLWLLHTLASVRDTAGRTRAFVEYDSAVADPLMQLRRICRVLSDASLNADGPEVRQFAEEFVEPRLRRERPEDSIASDDPFVKLQLELFAALQREAEATTARRSGASEAAWSGQVEILGPLGSLGAFAQRYAARDEGRRNALRQSVELREELERVNRDRAREAADARSEITTLKEWATSSEAHAKALEKEVGDLRKAYPEFSALAIRAREASDYARSLEGRVQELERLYALEREGRAVEQAEASKYVEALTAQSAKAEAYAKSLISELEALKLDAEQTRASLRQEIANLESELKALRGTYEAEREAVATEREEVRRYVESLKVHGTTAEDYARTLATEMDGLRRAHEAERSAIASERIEVTRYIESLKRAAAESETYAKSLLAELDRIRQTSEAERGAMENERLETGRYVSSLKEHAAAVESHARSLERDLHRVHQSSALEIGGLRSALEAAQVTANTLQSELQALSAHWLCRYFVPARSTSGNNENK